MVLKQNMALGQRTETGPYLVFAVSNQRPEHRGIAFVFYYLESIQPVLNVVSFNDDPDSVSYTHLTLPTSDLV